MMIKHFQQFFCSVPTPLAGLALGIASLGIILDNTFSMHANVQVLFAILSFALVFITLLKFTLNPLLLKNDIAHHIIGSVVPTITMAVMLQTKSLALFSTALAEAVWLFALIGHGLLLLLFVYYRFQSFDLCQMTPSWFIPCVGICVAGLSYPSEKLFPIAYYAVRFGMINFAILLPIMCYRLIFEKEIQDNFKPTIAILAAPASLCLASYLSVEKSPSFLILALLLGIAVFMTILVYFSFIKLLRLSFSPAFASYTFPMSVSATALYKISLYLAQFEIMHDYSFQIKMMAYFELAIAILVINFVMYSYVIYYIRTMKNIMDARYHAKIDSKSTYIQS